MSASLADDQRRWALLARVRGLRVQRRETLLVQAQHTARAARERVATCIERRARHAADLGDLLALCSHEQHGAAAWRLALARHRDEDASLCAAHHEAEFALSAALIEVGVASAALRREKRAFDDARARVKAAIARLREDE